MIKKLKIKFIATNMTLITIVMVIAFTALYVNSVHQLTENSKIAMHDIANSDNGGLDYFLEPNKKEESKYGYITTYIIDLDDRTNTCYLKGFGDVDNLSKEQYDRINALISAVRSAKTNEGVLEEYNMRFYTTRGRFGFRIVLLDKRYEDDNLKRIATSFLVGGSVAFAAFLAISILVAKIAVKPVEKSIKQQQQLVADVSHELKTPITVIATNADIVLTHPESTVEEQQKWLGYIKDETERMTELISMMLYLARTDESNDKPALSELDLSSTAYEIALLFESICFENKKRFQISIDPEIYIHGDSATIKQLIVILLDNAIKYSNENADIELCVYSQGDKALLSVYNTGEPIPKEAIPHIFERFFRVDKSRSRDSKKGGSGLGLSIAKRIIENNEGNISVTSSIENGTIFSCSFKLLKNKKSNKE